MMGIRPPLATAALTALVFLACARRVPEPAPPAPAEPPSRPLTIDAVYPEEDQRLTTRDTTFLFGNVSDANAVLWVNSAAVPVHANGAFLGWVVPWREPGDTTALFEVMAATDRDTAYLLRRVGLPTPPLEIPDDRLVLDTLSVAPRGVVWALAGEALDVSVRATAGAAVWIEWPAGERFALAATTPGDRPSAGDPRLTRETGSTPRQLGGALYRGAVPARAPLGRGAVEPPRLPVPRGPLADTAAKTMDTLPRATLWAAWEADTVRLRLPLDLWILDPARLPVVMTLDPPSPQGTDGIVYGRPTSNGTYVWFFHDRQRLAVSGRMGDRLRVQLAPDLHAWIDLREQVPLPDGTPPPRAKVGTVRILPGAGAVEVRVALSERVPYRVREDGRRLELALYSAFAETDWLFYGATDDFLRSAEWRQEPGGLFVLSLDVREEPWGYRVRSADEGLVLTIRRPPRIDRGHPLRGRRIALDPGHPPAGATGPTRLYEGDVNLGIAVRLKALLEQRGAEVMMTRSTAEPVPLYDRPLIAESADAEMVISIHNNALADGVNPFENHGTSVFYFHPHSLGLARALQEHLLRTLGLRDLGIGRANLALARPTWMPAALTEGAFMMIPEQEAALGTPEFRERYAEGVLRGIEEFLRRTAAND
ncbi:MAG: N-acetylmuramoyl-L-alanine amidase [Gemmatimonadetes bacterium]|nr:N-acetylmuramoyl-L-alanine amidase [Gemmatimonadota bacterium]